MPVPKNTAKADLGIFELGDLTVETVPIALIREGRRTTLDGYVAGPRCPVRIKSGVAAARFQYFRALAAIDEQGAAMLDPIDDEDLTPEQVARIREQRVREATQDDRMAALDQMYVDVLHVVIHGIELDEAAVIAGRDGTNGTTNDRDALLARLKWMDAPDETDSPDPEAEGGADPSTTPSSSPSSTTSTAPTTG